LQKNSGESIKFHFVKYMSQIENYNQTFKKSKKSFDRFVCMKIKNLVNFYIQPSFYEITMFTTPVLTAHAS